MRHTMKQGHKRERDNRIVTGQSKIALISMTNVFHAHMSRTCELAAEFRRHEEPF